MNSFRDQLLTLALPLTSLMWAWSAPAIPDVGLECSTVSPELHFAHLAENHHVLLALVRIRIRAKITIGVRVRASIGVRVMPCCFGED